MPLYVVPRTATANELEFLSRMLSIAATTGRRWKQGIENGLVLWATTLLGVTVVWCLLGWVAGRVLGTHLGLTSTATVWVLGIATPICAAFSAVSSVRWIRSWADLRPELRADVEAAQVHEEHYLLSATMRFQEPEHGGLIYCFHTNDDKVLVLFDHESQALGAEDKDPLASSFQPKSELLMVRAPRTGIVISKAFSGAPLDAGDPIQLHVDFKDWPEADSYCSIPWSQLQSRLGPPVNGGRPA